MGSLRISSPEHLDSWYCNSVKFCVCKLVRVCAQLGCCTHACGSIVVDQLTWLLPTVGAPVEVVGNVAGLPLSRGLVAACYS